MRVPFRGTIFIKFGQLNLGHAHKHILHALKHAWPQKPTSFLFRKESRLKCNSCPLCLNRVYSLHVTLADPKESKEIFVSHISCSKWYRSSAHFKLQLSPKCIKELNIVVITCQDLRVWLHTLKKSWISVELIQHEESFSSFYKLSSNLKQSFYSINIIGL